MSELLQYPTPLPGQADFGEAAGSAVAPCLGCLAALVFSLFHPLSPAPRESHGWFWPLCPTHLGTGSRCSLR